MSKFIVSARKYRPVKFEDVIGQNHIAKTLQNAFQTEQLAHAFLFCGPRGLPVQEFWQKLSIASIQ